MVPVLALVGAGQARVATHRHSRRADRIAPDGRDLLTTDMRVGSAATGACAALAQSGSAAQVPRRAREGVMASSSSDVTTTFTTVIGRGTRPSHSRLGVPGTC